MSGFLGFLIIVALFVIRFAIPLGVIILSGYLVNRLYASWDREEQFTVDA